MTTALVTGANRGIGLELCRIFTARGDEVLAVCRGPSPELRETGAEIQVPSFVERGDRLKIDTRDRKYVERA